MLLSSYKRCFGFLALVSSCLAADTRKPKASHAIDVPMTPAFWQEMPLDPGKGRAELRFFGHEGFPEGVMELRSGTALLNGLSFANGTIDFDVKALGQDIPGIQFRRQDTVQNLNAEEFYIRTFPECRASNDCIQYAPVINGFMLWNAYPQYQTHAFILDGWNHIKLVISGERMNVYVNRFPDPALVVGRLESSSRQGGIALRGPAVYANLHIAPDAVEGLSAKAIPDPTSVDRGYVRTWQVGPLMVWRSGISPTYTDMPAALNTWQTVTAGGFGMVNLNRIFSLDLGQPRPLAWLHSTFRSDRTQTKHVSMGWLGEVWVFVNGKLITQGKNYYEPESERRSPDGRMSLENGSFDVPLTRGSNEIVVALCSSIHDESNSPNRYGWGLEMRFDDPTGLAL